MSTDVEGIHGAALMVGSSGTSVDAAHGVALVSNHQAGTTLPAVFAVALISGYVPPEPVVVDPEGPDKAPTSDLISRTVTYTQAELSNIGDVKLRGVWNLPTQSQTVALGGALYRVRVRWSARRQRWVMDLLSSAGDPILVGRVLQARGVLFARRGRGMPDWVAIASGPEDYTQSDLGTNLRITFFPMSALKTTRQQVASLTEVVLDG